MKVIVDTDPGIDDAVALGMMLSRKDVDIIGVTTVNGNVDVEKATINALKVLDAFDRKDIPVFKGAYSAIIGCKHNGVYYHGEDGLGNSNHSTPDTSPLQDENAADAINRLVHLHKGEVTIIALGALTNLALALRLNKSLPNELKELVIMGGNYKGVGNFSMAAEFNFFIDPVAAHIVMEEFTCPKYLITWELSKQPFLSMSDVSEYRGHDNKRSKFMDQVLPKGDGNFCDAVAVAVATNREIITKKHDVYATVEMHGAFTRGLVVIDWEPRFRQTGEPKAPNVVIVDEIDVDIYRKLFLDSVK